MAGTPGEMRPGRELMAEDTVFRDVTNDPSAHTYSMDMVQLGSAPR